MQTKLKHNQTSPKVPKEKELGGTDKSNLRSKQQHKPVMVLNGAENRTWFGT